MSLPPSVAVLGLAVAFGVQAVGLARSTPAVEAIDWPRIRRGLARLWAVLLVVVALVGVAGEPADLGVRVPSAGTLIDGLLYGFAGFAGTMLFVGLLARYGRGLAADPASLVVFEQSLARRLAVAVTGATVETTLFYGFTLEALVGLGTAPWLAGVLGAAGLVLVRLRWGVRQALQWLPGAVVLAGLAVATRTLFVVLAVRMAYDVLVVASGDADDYDVPDEAG